MSYFQEAYNGSKNKIKVKLDLSNYATTCDLRNSTGGDISKCVKMADLARLKTKKGNKSAKWFKKFKKLSR